VKAITHCQTAGVLVDNKVAEPTSLEVHCNQTCVNAAMMMKMQSPMWNT